MTGWQQERPIAEPWPIGRPQAPAYGLIFRGERPSDLVGIGVEALSPWPTVPMPEGVKGLSQAVKITMRSHRRPSSGTGSLCHSFELGPLDHDHATSKEVGSKMVEGAGAAVQKIRGKATPKDRRLTVPSSIFGIRASGIGRLRACECACACA